MKQRSTYLLVIIFLVIYITKGIATVLPVAVNEPKSIGWMMPDECESEDCNQKTVAAEEDVKSIYFDDGSRALIVAPVVKITQQLLREHSIKYNSICAGPSTPPPELV